MYKTELHCHSTDVSMCSRLSADDIIRRYTENGYASLVLTNHFCVYTYGAHNCQSWDEWIDLVVGAYQNLKEKAKGKLNVLLGAEFRFDDGCWNDYLVFGLTEEFLRSLDFSVFKLGPGKFKELAHEHGCLLIQAHPFRFGMTLINPKDLDGIEVFNGAIKHNSNNDIAKTWAEKYGLIATSGTDLHYNDFPINGGIETEEEITTIEQLCSVLKSGNYQLLSAELPKLY